MGSRKLKREPVLKHHFAVTAHRGELLYLWIFFLICLFVFVFISGLGKLSLLVINALFIWIYVCLILSCGEYTVKVIYAVCVETIQRYDNSPFMCSSQNGGRIHSVSLWSIRDPIPFLFSFIVLYLTSWDMSSAGLVHYPLHAVVLCTALWPTIFVNNQHQPLG